MVAGANAAEPREATEFGANLGNLRMFQLKVVPKFLCQITSTAKRDAALGAVPGNRCSDSRFVIGTRRSNPNYERIGGTTASMPPAPPFVLNGARAKPAIPTFGGHSFQMPDIGTVHLVPR